MSPKNKVNDHWAEFEKGGTAMKKQRRWMITVTLFMFCLWAGAALGADKITVRVMGGFAKTLNSEFVERPFFEKLGKESGDKLDIQFRTMDELGQKGFQAMRQLKTGVFDILEVQLGYISGDDPLFKGVDLVGICPDLETFRKAVEAYRDMADRHFQKRLGGKLLALWHYGDQVFYFKDKIDGLKDFPGKKIRIFSRDMGDFVAHFGATAVTLPVIDVFQAMERGVVDGGVTGILAGNILGWHEVANYLYPLSIGYSIQAHVATLQFWNKLDPNMKEFLTKKFKAMEDDMWRLMEETRVYGINCNTGKDPCKYGKKGKMNLVPVSKEDKEQMKKAVGEIILPNWGKECNKVYDKCTEEWDQTVGKVTGFKIK
jgi:TRAP-type C4-dicarboxylate transport system substrate-binding protein